MDVAQIIFTLLGGLGLFLFGIKQMEDGLRQLAGDYFKQLMTALTRNRFIGMIVGFVVTTLTQSSSATTVMVVGFINAGFITFAQALGFILGANIGSTTTGQLMSFKLDRYALLMLGIGAILYLFSSTEREKIRNGGLALLGFGMLFFGMAVMKDAIVPLQEGGYIEHWFSMCNAHSTWSIILAILIGAGATAVVQSSGATVGIIIALGACGVVRSIADVIPLILGCEIGTCATALLASLRTNRAASKSAVAHTLINIFGCVIVLASFRVWVYIVPLTAGSMPRQIANAHTLFSLVKCLCFLPLIPIVVRVLDWVLPDKTPTMIDLLTYRTFNKSEYLHKRYLDTPDVALIQAHKEVNVMVQVVSKMIRCLRYGFIEGKEEKAAKVPKYEDIMDNIKKDLHDYIVLLSQGSLTSKQATEARTILEGASDLERMADHVETMLSFVRLKKEGTMVLDANNTSRVIGLIDKAVELASLIQSCVEHNATGTRESIIALAKDINGDIKTARAYYNDCLRRGSWNLFSDLAFMELITALEKFCVHSLSFVSQYVGELQRLNVPQYKFVDGGQSGEENM